jgi:hypothetical protein
MSGTTLSSKNKERKELKTPGTNQTAPPSSYPMENGKHIQYIYYRYPSKK